MPREAMTTGLRVSGRKHVTNNDCPFTMDFFIQNDFDIIDKNREKFNEMDVNNYF